MPDLTDVYSALKQADAAGDTASAQQLADYIRSQSAASAPAAVSTTPPATPAPTAPAAPPLSFSRVAGLADRSTFQGLSDVASLPQNLLNLADSSGFAIRARLRSALGLPAETYDAPATTPNLGDVTANAMGLPSPQGSGEQLYSHAIRGATAGIAGGAGVFDGAIANVARAGVGGAAGGTASEAARQNGASPFWQFVAGTAGGLAPAGAEGLARAGTHYVGNLLRPLTASGQEQVAANLLMRQASDPQAAAANLEAAAPIVPGSARTTGEASGDIGLLTLEKGVRNQNPVAFGERISQQNSARQAQLAGMGGTAQDVVAAQSARDTATGPMREAALGNEVGGTIGAPTSIVHDTIDQILASPAGARQTVSQTMGWARDLIGNETDPARLYEIRKDLQLAQAGKLQPSSPNAPNAATLAQARGQLGQVVASLDNAIDYAAPGFKDYLDQYRSLSRPIDQMRTIQGIAKRAQGNATDVTTGSNFLSPSAYSRALDSATEQRGSGLTADQMQRLEALRTDLQNSQAINSPLIRPPGSDTFHNLSLAQVLQRGSSNPASLVRLIASPIGWAYKTAGSDSEVNQVLSRAMLDPAFAASLLRRGQPSLPFGRVVNQSFGGTPAYGLGGLAGSAPTLPSR